MYKTVQYIHDIIDYSYFIKLTAAWTWFAMKFHFGIQVLLVVMIILVFNHANIANYAYCGISYGCFGYPSNCVDSKSCDFFVTYTKKVNGDVTFNLIASESDMRNGYISPEIKRIF